MLRRLKIFFALTFLAALMSVVFLVHYSATRGVSMKIMDSSQLGLKYFKLLKDKLMKGEDLNDIKSHIREDLRHRLFRTTARTHVKALLTTGTEQLQDNTIPTTVIPSTVIPSTVIPSTDTSSKSKEEDREDPVDTLIKTSLKNEGNSENGDEEILESETTTAPMTEEIQADIVLTAVPEKEDDNEDQELCPSKSDTLVGPLFVNQNVPKMEELEKHLSESYGGWVKKGGTWKPTECKARTKMALIVPFRKRYEQLGIFVRHMHPMLKRQNVDYRIVIVEQVCRQFCIPYVIAPFEADAQIAYLTRNGFADIVITEDSDLLAYRCEKVLYKLQMDGTSDYLEMAQILHHLNLNPNQFLSMCVIAGCDYLPNIKTIGIHKAKKIVESVDFVTVLEKHKNSPPGYRNMFLQAIAVFNHQLVYKIKTSRVQPLTEWREGREDERHRFGPACGQFFNDNLAPDFAIGNIDVKSKEKANSFPIPKNEDEFLCKGLQVNNSGPEVRPTSTPNLNLTVQNICKDWFAWTIPGFPVLDIEFKEAKAIIDGKPATILVKRDDSIMCHTKLICTSHCDVLINGVTRTVVWKWHCDQQHVHDDGEPDVLESGTMQQNGTFHTVPFKVMGVAYSKEGQEHLEKAYNQWSSIKDTVRAQIQPEPTNRFDTNAISVKINYGTIWVKIGYIASELTKFVHRAFQIDSIVSVSIKHIKFRTTYMKVGYYVTLDITKAGEWDAAVVKASKKVQ